MRVTYLTPYISRTGGGVSNSVQRVAQSVAELDGTVEVFAFDDPFASQDLSNWKPLVPRVFPRQALKKFGWAPELERALRGFEGKETIVHQHGIWTYISIVCHRWGRRTRQPTIISPHGMLDPWALANSRWKKQLALFAYERKNLFQCSCIHAMSESEMESIRSFGLNGAMAFIPNGVDIPPEKVVPKPPHKDQRRVLLFLGRMHPKKGLIPLLDAWHKLGKGVADWHLVMAGPDEIGHVAQVQKHVKNLGLENSVSYIGPQYGEAKDACLRHADAFVLSSFSEGFPIAILEAMAYGLPVLMSPQCNFPEAMRANVALCADMDVPSIASGLRELLGMTDEQRKDLGARSREFVAKNYTWESVGRQMMDVYRWLLGGGSAPGFVSGKR
ncbi:MAG: glycosyltransferase [Planctomycetota bacterium]